MNEIKSNTKPYVKKYLHEHMPIPPSEATLQKITNCIKAEYNITTSAATIKKHIIDILYMDFGLKPEDLSSKNIPRRLKNIIAEKKFLYLVLSTYYNPHLDTYSYYFKIGQTISPIKRYQNYISHSPGLLFIGFYQINNHLSLNFYERTLRDKMTIYCHGIPYYSEWVKITKEDYKELAKNGKQLFESFYHEMTNLPGEWATNIIEDKYQMGAT